MSEDKLTRDDLVLLMESYRNMITMHQTILDQTTKTIDAMSVIATKQDSLFSKQSSICTSINGMNDKLNALNGLKDTVVSSLNKHEKKTIEEHGKLANKIYVGWIGMGTIIIGLVGLIYTITDLIKHTTPM